jgi:UDP-glucose 4-epimerase
MNVLVSGGAGFIGSWLAEALLDRGHSVWIVDDLSTGFRHNVPAAAHFLEADLCSSEAQDWIRAARPEVVFHQAAQLDVRKSVADPVFDARVNILGTLYLLESCVATGVRQFIFASSGGTVYGEPEAIPVPENHPICPVSPYGIAKASVEMYLDYYQQQYGLTTCSLRYGNVYGPRQNPHGEAGVVAIFAQKLLAGQQPVINGTGEQTRDYVYVHDVVAANLAAFDRSACGAFNIGTGIETNVVQIFEHLNALAGYPVERVHGPAKAGEQQRVALDCALASRELGWHAEVDLESGLRETFAWFQRYHTP